MLDKNYGLLLDFIVKGGSTAVLALVLLLQICVTNGWIPSSVTRALATMDQKADSRVRLDSYNCANIAKLAGSDPAPCYSLGHWAGGQPFAPLESR